jgi:two-component system phosphate regulon response regulator PhoB
MATERLLIKSGCLVVSAKDGEEALPIACQERPDVVLLDMMLPKLSGPEVLRGIKANLETANVPVIVLTGLSQKNEARLLEDGASAFVEKSAALDNPELLLSVIRQVLRTAALAAELHGLPATPATPSASISA